MKVREGLKEWFHDIENDPQKGLHLLAFRDFCFDLFEEENGSIHREEDRLPTHQKAPHSHLKKFLSLAKTVFLIES